MLEGNDILFRILLKILLTTTAKKGKQICIDEINMEKS